MEPMVLYNMTIEPFNYSLVFGCMFGVAMIIKINGLVISTLSFVRGWRI